VNTFALSSLNDAKGIAMPTRHALYIAALEQQLDAASKEASPTERLKALLVEQLARADAVKTLFDGIQSRERLK